jgi:hypothetical protein
MIFCARATRGLRRPSLDARSGRSSAPFPEKITSEIGGIIYMDDDRSMRAVKGSLTTPLRRGGEKIGRVRLTRAVRSQR